MNCECHDVPAGWAVDRRVPAGGRWECRVKRAEYNARARADTGKRDRGNAQRRDRYDADPVYRIGKNLHDKARARAATLKRRREQLG